MDRKTFAFKLTNLDFAGRTVEGYANVFGVKDLVGDIVHPGAFSKTLVERGGKVKFLWQHDPGEPLGRMLEMQEDQHGLFFKAIISDTARGRDALSLLRDGAVDSFSIGYDAVKGGTDYSKDPASGDTIRNLRELKLYEVSLVTLPANEMATVTALKQQGPSEGKPYGVFMNGDQHCVYKIDEEGERMGESLGCHATEDEAMAQMRAIMANEKEAEAPIEDEKADTGKTDEKEEIPGDEEVKAGRVLARRNADRIMNAMTLLHEALMDAGLMDMDEEDDKDKSIAAPDNEAADNKPESDKQAGPVTEPPTSEDLLRLIEISLNEIEISEV